MDFAQAVTWLQNQCDAGDDNNLRMCKNLMNQLRSPATTKDMWHSSALLLQFLVMRSGSRGASRARQAPVGLRAGAAARARGAARLRREQRCGAGRAVRHRRERRR